MKYTKLSYFLLEWHLQPDDDKLQERYIKCRNEKMLCGQSKKSSIMIILGYIEKHNERKKKFIPVAKEMLLHEEN